MSATYSRGEVPVRIAPELLGDDVLHVLQDRNQLRL